MFIVVRGKEERMREIPAYLYEGQSVASEPVVLEGAFLPHALLVVDTGDDSRFRGEYVRDRINSGSFGAILFDTRQEADDYIEAERNYGR